MLFEESINNTRVHLNLLQLNLLTCKVDKTPFKWKISLLRWAIIFEKFLTETNTFLHSQSLKIENKNKVGAKKQWRDCILCISFVIVLCFWVGARLADVTWDLGYSSDFRFYGNNISLKILWEIKSIFVTFRFILGFKTANTYKLDESLTGRGDKKQKKRERNHERKKKNQNKRKNNWTHFTQLLFLPLLRRCCRCYCYILWKRRMCRVLWSPAEIIIYIS